MSRKTYSHLITLRTFEERFNYLLLNSKVSEETFGYDRYLNQAFYKSSEWRKFRRDIIVRDMGCEMGLPDYEINGLIIIHHLNPIDKSDILEVTENLINPDNVVCVSKRLHNAIHYGDFSVLEPAYYERTEGDTKLW